MAGAFEIVSESRREIVQKIINMMEKEGFFGNMSSWNRAALCPQNPLSGTKYKGGNRIRLMQEVIENGYTDPRWATLRQYKEKGYYPKKGEKGVLCEKWIFSREKTIINELGKKEKILEALDNPVVSYFKVFNAEQIQNFPKYISEVKEYTEVNKLSDQLIETSECPILEAAQSRAFYSPGKDKIVLPLRGEFKNEVSFLQTLIHEMGHSTGHESRLNRNFSGDFGSPEYAKEELRAEIASVFTALDLGVALTAEHYEDHSDYLKSWITVLKNDHNELFRACSDAEKISEHLIQNYDKKFVRKIEQQKKIETAKPKIRQVRCR